jgi:hypothetical protein
MEKPSSRYKELQWNVEVKTVNILEYAEFSYNFRRLHETICLRHFTISILIFFAGLWAVYQNSIFTAAALLGLAIACLLSSISSVRQFSQINSIGYNFQALAFVAPYC